MVLPEAAVAAARRPHILVLTPRYPYPVVGGDRLRIYHVCRELAKTCDLTLLSLCDSNSEYAAPLPEDGVFAHVERIYMSKWRSRLNAVIALPRRTPLQVAYYRNARFRRRIRELMRDHDACLAHLIRTGDMALGQTGKPLILEMTDAISLNYGRVRSDGKRLDWRTWLFSFEARRLLRYERAVLDKFDLVTLVSPIDRSYLLDGEKSDHVLVCSNGVDLSRFPFREPAARERHVVFIGDMRTMPNRDACEYFIVEVLPLLRRQGDFKFRIVGRISDEEAQRFAMHEGVEVLANVKDVAEAVGNAFAGVAPMRLGAGVQNKILEYMATGVPTVTSSVGLEGLGARPDVDVLVANDPAEYVQQLVGLWRDPERARVLARNARAYIERVHLWSGQLAPMLTALGKLLDVSTR